MNEAKKGGISVNTENIFPVIKKWLYSEKDIFLRELVSNATDAVTKHKRLCALGEATGDDTPYRIDVVLDREAKTITVQDNGIGMSEEELKKYICSIALSGAVDFLQKYESGNDTAKGGIIGHFGLGFYSAFMVSDKVEIHTRSFTGAPAVHWICNGEGEYEIEASDREARGTEIILHVSDEEDAYLNPVKLRAMLDKYCAFMPVEIYFDDGAEDRDAPSPINDTTPLWQKPISECTEEEYTEFYHKVFPDMRDPLFHIHLNADYPLNFKGILYFPRINPHFESAEGQVKLYYNQVFVADNVSEVIPEYLLMLRGVLDCPELPLNVSRSYLQTNSYVSKLSAHIVKKVADKLTSLCNTDREQYEKVWGDIKTFVSFAAMHDEKFYDRVKNAILLQLTSGKCVTIKEYLEGAPENAKIIYYTTDKALQAQYVAMVEAENIAVAELDTLLDTQFIAYLESRSGEYKFRRVDADLSVLGKEGDGKESEALTALFRKIAANEKLDVKLESLKNTEVPALLNVPEEFRRMQDSMRMYRMMEGEQMADELPMGTTLILNAANPLIGKLEGMLTENEARAERFASYIYKLCLISAQKLSPAQMQAFLAESYALLSEISQ